MKFNLNPEPKTFPTSNKTYTLYEINKAFDTITSTDGRYTGIKGEYYARMVIFTNFVLGRKPVILKGPRSSGKTNIMSIVTTFCKKPLILSTSSEKAEFRDSKNLNKATHFIIPEINKVNDIVVEILKDMGEGAPTQYKFTDHNKMTSTVTIDPKPFITSIADENKKQDRLGEELISRMTIVSTDASTKQNVRVIKEKLSRAQNPYQQQEISTERVEELQKYVHQLPPIQDYVFIYLPGQSVVQAIPPQFTDSRRDTDKYIDNTKGITLFHIKDRMIIKHKNKENILVTPADVWYNHVIYEEVLLQSALKAGPLERAIMNIVKNNNGALMTIVEIRNEILDEGLTPSHAVVKKACNTLSEIGYLTRHDDRPIRYELNAAIKSNYTGDIDWTTTINECKRAVKKQFPKYADEYIKRFCTAPINVIDPFDGKTIDITKTVKKTIRPKPEPVIKTTIDTKKKTTFNLTPKKQTIDPIEILRDKIKDILRNQKQEIPIEDIIHDVRESLSYEEDEIEREVRFLNTMQELIYKNGKARILE